VTRASGFAQRRALGSLLTHLSILLILAGAVSRAVWGEKGFVELREGRTVTQFETANGAKPLPFALQLTKFEIETDPAAEAPGAVKNFRSTLNIFGAGAASASRTLAVNSPLRINGYAFYQTGYNPDDLTWTSLEVVRDPGVPLVYGGFTLLLGGLFTVFYLNPWITAREANA
jgi:cytochrome c biogenesis protein ResB